MRWIGSRRTIGTASLIWLVVLGTAWGDPPHSESNPAAKPTVAIDSRSATDSTTGAIPQVDHRVVDPADATLEQALDLERKRDWSSAMTVYEDALEKWPDHTRFRHRLRLCEIHYRLNRRYQDQSFRKTLLHLSNDQALQVLDEIFERIETNYVEPVRIEPLLRGGLDNLEVALRDPVFLKANVPQASADRVLWLRDRLRQERARVVARDRIDARRFVIQIQETSRQAIGLSAVAVVLEFAFGACDALDDYTSCLTPDKLEDLYAMIDGNFVGLGVELKLDHDSLLLLSIIHGGPAEQAGLKAGDRIVQINDRAVKGLSIDEAASRLQGEEGSRLAITVLKRDGASKRFTLIRRSVEVESVPQSKIVDQAAGIGYVQLTGFQKSSLDELRRAIARLEAKGMRYLVLDLRGNPGGLLNVAVSIADQFLDRGVIVTTRGRGAEQSEIYRATGRSVWHMPVSILIDHESASASEILAGALQENGRARIVGRRSFGKGSVQSIFSLRTAPAGLKLTTAKFYSPLDRPYSEQGVPPDILVRTAAKPKGSDPLRDVEFGDPKTDPVLTQAIQTARGELARSR